jgi:cytochrome c biogenesis protein CcdA
MTVVIRSLILVACALAALALLIATIGAVLAIITGHARWIELAWISIAASLLAIVLGQLWPTERNPDLSDRTR